jgi:hypothetical protein
VSRRAGRRIASALAAAVLVLLAAACTDDEGGGDEGPDGAPTTTPSTATTVPTTATGISEEEALAIAVDHQQAEDPEFDVESTRPVVIREGDAYDVSFPPANLTGRGGEPHVVVDRTTGEVVDAYVTR